MRLPGYLTAFALALLLASTTPVGAGSGMHQLDLLHPLFSHVHLVNGRFVTHEGLVRRAAMSETRATPGPALGSGDASGSPDAGLGISPSGLHLLPGFVLDESQAFILEDVDSPLGREEAPPKPPPL